MKKVLIAGFWVGVYLAVVLTPLAVLLLTPTPSGGGFWWDVAVGLGFAGLVMMGIQFLLTARFRRAAAPFGIDILYYFHRYLAYVAVGVLVAHPVILILVNPGFTAYLNPFAGQREMAAGAWAVLLLLVLVVTSAGRKWLRIPYEGWRVAHLGLAVGAVGFGFLHMESIGYYSATPAMRALWFLIGASLVAVVIWVRGIRPWSLVRRPFRVRQVRAERGSSWTVTVEPDGHDGFDFAPGQFAWVTLRGSPFLMREHPFSIASAPTADGVLGFTIKELGDFTRTIGRIEPGEPAYVDGPYGSFSIDRVPGAPGYVFLAGGIGIAPMASMLRALAERGDRRPHILFAAHGSWDRVPLRESLAELEGRLDLRVIHVLENPPADWTGEVGWITRELLERSLPGGRRELEYFVCGPVPMIRAVEGFLQEMGIPAGRIHTELFDLV